MKPITMTVSPNLSPEKARVINHLISVVEEMEAQRWADETWQDVQKTLQRHPGEQIRWNLVLEHMRKSDKEEFRNNPRMLRVSKMSLDKLTIHLIENGLLQAS